jgi:hypothetical protein
VTASLKNYLTARATANLRLTIRRRSAAFFRCGHSAARMAWSHLEEGFQQATQNSTRVSIRSLKFNRDLKRVLEIHIGVVPPERACAVSRQREQRAAPPRVHHRTLHRLRWVIAYLTLVDSCGISGPIEVLTTQPTAPRTVCAARVAPWLRAAAYVFWLGATENGPGTRDDAHTFAAHV